MIKDRLRERFPNFVAHHLARKFSRRFLHFLAKLLIRFRPARETDDRNRRRQFAVGREIVERRHELAVRQVAGRSKNHDGARLWHRACGETFPQRIRL